MTEKRFAALAKAVVLAAVAGGLVLVIEIMAGLTLWAALASSARSDIGADDLLATVGPFLMLAGLVGGNAMMFFAVGLLVIGVPVWWGLHRTGLRGRAAAVAAGGCLAPAASVVLVFVYGPWLAALLILPGALAGWTLHRVAYGPGREAA